MKINPSQFAFYLKSSSLSSTEQRVLLKRLPTMQANEIEILFKRLQQDHQLMAEVLQQAHAKQDNLYTQLEFDLRREKK